MLLPTAEPHRRVVRTHHGKEYDLIAGVAIAGWIASTTLRPEDLNAHWIFGPVLALVLWLRVRRTVVDRQRRSFAARLPWGPNALEPKHPFADGPTLRSVRRKRGGALTVTWEVHANGQLVCDGMQKEEAERLVDELRRFLGP
jgi:hypothetical protein